MLGGGSEDLVVSMPRLEAMLCLCLLSQDALEITSSSLAPAHFVSMGSPELLACVRAYVCRWSG